MRPTSLLLAISACLLACGPPSSSEAPDCAGDTAGIAYLDACGQCVGGETGEVACSEDCNGDRDGTAFVDACGACVGGSTGAEACALDCHGDPEGSAWVDACGHCVGGDTGADACVQDCAGVEDGAAFVDACGSCVGGDTGVEACVQDCAGVEDGAAFVDACGRCVGGTTELPACVLDCNGDPEGSAYEDRCGACVGGETGEVACVEDCAGELGGSAVIDGCGTCVGGATGTVVCPDACGPDRHGEAGARYLSIVSFEREHAFLYETEATEQSRFGVVNRLGGLTWLYVYQDVVLDPGHWVVDYRVAVAGRHMAEFNLKAVPDVSACGVAANRGWSAPPDGKDAWQVTPEPLELRTHQACTVRLSLLDSQGIHKHEWGLDWARIRRACNVDTDCVTVPGGPFGTCEIGVCQYPAACDAGAP